MKIAVLIHELLVQGGGERQCVALARALSNAGHRVTVYTSQYASQSCYPEMCSTLDIRVVGRGPLPHIQSPSFLRRLLDMQAMVRRIQERHEVWNPHHSPAHWAAVWLKRKLGGSVIWMCNDVPDFMVKAQHFRQSASIWKRLGQYLYSWMYRFDSAQVRRIDKIVVLSEWAKAELLKVYSGQVVVVRSGMDHQQLLRSGDRESFRQRFAIASDCFLILWFGILMPHRRLQDAITATALLRQRGYAVRLLLAGSGRSHPSYLRYLKQLVQATGIQNSVIFAGPVRESEICDAFAACDVFLFPNEEQTWGLTVMEAMAAGRPVVVSRGSGVHEVLQDGVNAFLVLPRAPEVIAAKLELLIRNSKLCFDLAEEGRRYVLSTFSWEKYARDMAAVFEQTLVSNETGVSCKAQAVPRFAGRY